MTRSRLVNAVRMLSCAIFCVMTCRGESLVAVSARGESAVKLYSAVRDILRLVKSVPAGKSPGEMCLDPGGKHLFVGLVAENRSGSSICRARRCSAPSLIPASNRRTDAP